jgi:predicted ribosome quality control (RQC) complex YloA/Tae2 family protein
MAKFREFKLPSGAILILGKDENSNDKLVKDFQGKPNTILHTVASGSPFGVIDTVNPTKAEIFASGAIVSKYSQDWRDNKNDVKVSVFTGENVQKKNGMKVGSWNVKESEIITINKNKILQLDK